MTVQHVAEIAASAPETIDHFARLLARSARKREIFKAIYRGQRQSPRSAAEIARATKLSAKQVLTLARPLAAHKLFEQLRHEGRVGYRKYPHIAPMRDKILRLATSRAALEKHVTTRRPRVTLRVHHSGKATFRVDVEMIGIDDIDNFSLVRNSKYRRVPRKLPPPLPETQFKGGVAAVLGNRGKFKDWGGERNDLYTTLLRLNGKRYPAAIAFKGPGVKGTLTPGKLGKNGDQIQRLFLSPAQVFLVQYEGEIAESVIEQMKTFSIAQSGTQGEPIRFGVVAREDSVRLRMAYASAFDAE